MTEVSSVGSRLREVRRYLRLTLEQFYKPITPHTTNMSAIEKGSRVIGKGLLRDITDYYSLNTTWVSTGEGEMFLEGADPLRPSKSEGGGVPYYNIDLSQIPAESLAVMEEKPEYYVDYKPFNDCAAYLPVYGDSMYPKYASGEIVAVKQIANFDVIQWGEAYLVVTDEASNNLRTIKLLFPHDDENKLVLRASNPNYRGDTVISKSSLLSLYIIKGKITRTLI